MTRFEGIQVVVGLLLALIGVATAFGLSPALIVAGAFLVIDVQVERRLRGRSKGVS